MTVLLGLCRQVVAYGISINLVEVTWKSKIKAQFPNPNDYSAFMGDFSSATGAVTFVMMLLSRFIFRKVFRHEHILLRVWACCPYCLAQMAGVLC